MKKALLIRPDAEYGLTEAYGWYEAQVPGLGADFLLSIDAALSSIQRIPEMYPIVYKNVRRSLARRFPRGCFRWLRRAGLWSSESCMPREITRPGRIELDRTPRYQLLLWGVKG